MAGSRQARPVPPPRRPAVLRGRVFRARDVLDAGVVSPSALRSSAWRRLYRGVYADAELPDGPDLRISGACLLMPAAAVFSGRTAAHLHGAGELVDVGTPVEVSVPAGARLGPVAGLRVRRTVLPATDVTVVRRRPCTTGTRTALDIARTEPLVEAVAALDVLLARGVVDRAGLRRSLDATPSPRGVRQAGRAVELADPRAESLPESRVRVLLALAGMDAVPQYTVRGADGDFVARVDLAFPEHRLAVEYDGAWHGEAGQLGRDRRRLNRLTAAGWRVVFVTAADLRDPDGLVARVAEALGR
jgi:G:T-mismatch repair DNA endonuclease (very short patch repair protein)